jgi:hypothetical protein
MGSRHHRRLPFALRPGGLADPKALERMLIKERNPLKATVQKGGEDQTADRARHQRIADKCQHRLQTKDVGSEIKDC